MDTQQAVAEGTHTDGQSDSKRDGQQKFTLGPNDSLEGKLTYGGHMAVDGGDAEGEVRVGGKKGIGKRTLVKALIEGSHVALQGGVGGQLAAPRKRTLRKAAKPERDSP